MPSSLLETPPAVRRGSRLRRAAGWLTALVVVAVLAVPAIGAVRGLLPSFGNPLTEQTVDRTGPALITALTDLHQYRASRGTFSVVVDLEHDTKYVPSVIKGERTTYVAQGSVDGVVDFARLGSGAVQAAPDHSAVTITLPRPYLSEAVIDPQASRVVGRSRGVVDRLGGVFADSPTSESDVEQLAQRKLDRAAADSDVLDRAEQGTRDMLTGMAHSFGYDQATVVFTQPTAP